MPSNYTSNYNLNQWESGDRVHHDDFNEDNRTIEAALLEKIEKQVILEQTVPENTKTYTFDVSGIDWGAWELVLLKVFPGTSIGSGMYVNLRNASNSVISATEHRTESGGWGKYNKTAYSSTETLTLVCFFPLRYPSKNVLCISLGNNCLSIFDKVQ